MFAKSGPILLDSNINIKVYHTTISNWCTNFAPLFDDIRIQLMPLLDLNSDEWHTDETVVKIAGVNHIWVESFKDDIFDNLIEPFNKKFKAWYKTKQVFSLYASANNLIFMFVFFNFVRIHSSLNSMTPAQIAGLKLSKKQKREFLLVA